MPSPPIYHGMQVPGKVTPISRNEFLAVLSIVGCINGLGARVIQSVNSLPLHDAIFRTFETSIIVWVACLAGVVLVLRDKDTESVRRSDLWMGTAVLLV